MELLALVVIAMLIVAASALAGSKSQLQITIDRGRELLMAGMPEKALRVFERLARQRDRNAPGRERALYWLARTYEELGQTDLARQTYHRYMREYVYTDHAPRADHETHHLVRQRLVRLGIPLDDPAETSNWSRYNLEKDRLAQAIKVTEIPQVTIKPHARLVSPPEAEPVSPEKLARDGRALAVGRRVGDYVLAEKLGEGGFGEVYRALRPVAIKLARDPAVIEHLRRFGTIQGLVKSDRVVRPLEVNLTADPPYVVMELVDGCTLRDLLETKEIGRPEALLVLREIALALVDAHDAGVLHLDLKPENVLLDESGKVKLTDFELGTMKTEEAAQARLSRTLGSSVSDAKIAGTLAYMSPEQRDGKVPDGRSDIYTFGVMLFEALTGEHPQPNDKPSDFRKDIAPGSEIDRIFEKCFTRHERRYASARELARDLEAVVARLPVKPDLVALLRAAPRAKERVAGRATRVTAGEPPITVTSERVETKKPVEDREETKPATTVEVGTAGPPKEAAEKPPEESPAPRPSLDVLIAERAAAAREAEAAAPVRPPILLPTEPPAAEAPVKPQERQLEAG